MADKLNRRNFVRNSMAASAAGAIIGMSFEEKALLAKENAPKKVADPKNHVPMGKIKDVKISRLICGGNLISGYAHSRDLIYVSPLLKHYFTDEKVMDTWQICEEHGINTMIVGPDDKRAVGLYNRYRKERGGKMQWLAQCQGQMPAVDLAKFAIDNGAVGAFLGGNLGDKWTFENRLDQTQKFVDYVNSQGIISGVAGHSLDMLIAVESAGIKNDFYMKTLHHTNYWSARKENQTRQVINNYGEDNYYAMTPEETSEFMEDVKKPWIAYKTLAAGAIKPASGFDYVFQKGADFACVGMFDWQIAEDVEIARNVCEKHKNRQRPWCA